MTATLAGVTDVVIGRVLWEEWRESWPPHTDGDPFAAFINPVRTHVLTSAGSGQLG